MIFLSIYAIIYLCIVNTKEAPHISTLFISDLDGTLLNSNAELSDFTISTINSLIADGMHFTYATARTMYTAEVITSRLNISVPCILNNGAEIYDRANAEYIRKACIPREKADRLIDAFSENHVGVQMFRVTDGRLDMYYPPYVNDLMRGNIENRRATTDQVITECSDLHSVNDRDVVYFASTGDMEPLLPIRETAMQTEGISYEFYVDTYTGKHYLEIFSDEASKANGVKFLREKYGFDRVVAFGDNLNDIAMFEQADVRIAVGNANEAVKKAADFVIDTNDNNGAAKWLASHYNE